jgi:hypothetical protein
MDNPLDLIAAERHRQLILGFTQQHDDALEACGQLGFAAACYAIPPEARDTSVPDLWPWDDAQWKPADDRVRELVKAGALIVAEIERVQRQAPLTRAEVFNQVAEALEGDSDLALAPA